MDTHTMIDDVLLQKHLVNNTKENNCSIRNAAALMNRNIQSRKLKTRLKELKTKALTEITGHVSSMVDSIVEEIDVTENGNEIINTLQMNNKKIPSENSNNKIIHPKAALPDKEFVPRNSIFTELYKVKHFRTLHNVFFSVLIILFINTAAFDYLLYGEIKLGFNLIIKGFGNLHIAMLMWMFMFALVLLLYTCFTIWADVRLENAYDPKKQKLWDTMWLYLLMGFDLFLLIGMAFAVRKLSLSPLSALLLLVEEIRFLMKTHAFVRSNVPKVKNHKSQGDESKEPPPYATFSNYLYFLFAPTMVYKDDYPRTTEIRWNYVRSCFVEVALLILYLSFISERFFVLEYQTICKGDHTWKNILVSILSSALPSGIVMTLMNYCILHSWLNGFAEMLQFSDRLFYLDWWNSTTLGGFFRTWNLIIQDWLYMYIYKDFYEFIFPRNKIIAKISVILISAIVHEYILSLMLGFFFPVVLILFGVVGLIMSYMNTIAGNTFLWVSFFVGNGVQFSLYSIEMFARINDPIDNDNFIDYFIPRFITC